MALYTGRVVQKCRRRGSHLPERWLKMHRSIQRVGNIVIVTGMTWKSWGEYIEFNIRKITENVCRVSISSKPRLRTTLIDYGVNLWNIDRIINRLNKEVHLKVTSRGH